MVLLSQKCATLKHERERLRVMFYVCLFIFFPPSSSHDSFVRMSKRSKNTYRLCFDCEYDRLANNIIKCTTMGITLSRLVFLSLARSLTRLWSVSLSK